MDVFVHVQQLSFPKFELFIHCSYSFIPAFFSSKLTFHFWCLKFATK